MIEPYPLIDPRRTKKLVAEFKRLAEIFIPSLRDITTENNTGHAFVEIAARLAGHVTQRLDKVPRRDAIAFFHTLDIPQQAPRSAQAALIFTLAEKREQPVFAPARIQVAAETEGGEEVFFETRNALKITPAILKSLVAVDSANDYLEEPPPQFFKLALPETPIEYKVVTLANLGQNVDVLQISPTLGLNKGDMIRIGQQVFRLKDVNKDGLVTLVNQDLLELKIEENTQVLKVTRFDVFKQRNLQQHVVYIGHAEALNLEKKSTIRLVVNPSSVASSLINLGLTYELYGTKQGEEAPQWQPFKSISAAGGELLLFKDWEGSVGEIEIHGNKNRWLKIQMKGKISDTQQADMRIASFMLRVESGNGIAQKTARDTNCCFEGKQQNDENNTGDLCISCELSSTQEGSQTVKQAFHNATPLPLTTSFSPFGSEPLRFDIFALAAPEALSKKGAKAAIAINLVDATPVVIESAYRSADPIRAYSIGVNGRLQVIELSNSGELRKWQELGHPQKLPKNNVGSEDIKTLRLDGSLSPQSIEIDVGGKVDRVVVGDQGGRLWVTKVSNQSGFFKNTDWESLPLLPIAQSVKVNDIAIFSSPLQIFVATQNGLFRLNLNVNSEISQGWEPVSPKDRPDIDNSNIPDFGLTTKIRTRLIPILNPKWPLPSNVSKYGLVLLDAAGIFWRGKLDLVIEPPFIAWEKITTPKSANPFLLGSPEVRPVAAAFDDTGNDFAIFASTQKESTLFALIRKGGNLTQIEPKIDTKKNDTNKKFSIQTGTAILCDPSFRLSNDGQPIVFAFGQNQENKPAIALWLKDDITLFDYPQNRESDGKASGILLPQTDQAKSAQPPIIIVNGRRETLYLTKTTAKSKAIKAFTLFDWLMPPNNLECDYVEFLNGIIPPKAEKLLGSLVIDRENGKRVYKWATGKFSNVTSYNLYKKLNSSNSFKGQIIDEKGGDTSISSKLLKLAPEDDATIKDSKLIIKTKIYNVESIDSNRVASLDIAISSRNAVDYVPTALITEVPVTISEDQIGTLIKLAYDKQDEPLFPIGRIEFHQSADPITQSINSSNLQSKFVWARLGSKWITKPNNDSNATVFLKSGIGNWSIESFQRVEQNPELSWEYFNGEGWRRLDKGFNDTTNHLAVSGKLCFRVPDDMTPTEISGKEDCWIRARLVGGDYGRVKYVVTTTPDSQNPKITTQTITVDNSELRAPEIVAIEACFQMDNALQPEIILTENNRDVFNQTQANTVSTASYTLFEGAASIDSSLKNNRALYLGFSKSYNVNPLSLYVDADEVDTLGKFPETIKLEFDVLAQGGRWLKVAVEDQTRGFQRRGMVKVFVDVAPQLSRLFGQQLFWLRITPPPQNGEDWAPLLKGIYINAAEAEQARSVKQEILGSSSGEPNQQFFLSKPPVISNSLELRVREVLSEEEGMELEQAKTVALDMRQLETQPVEMTTYPDIAGNWVLWRQVDSFVGYDGDARVYQLDPASGAVHFGNDKQGKIPPAGRDVVRAISYQNGGGEAGNVAAFTIEGLKSSVESVDRVTNPIPAAGGVDIPNIDLQIITAPDRLRHRQQALTLLDIEALAVSWSSEIVRARCIAPLEPNDPIKVFIARRTGERCPKATLAERDALARYLLDQGWGALDDTSIQVYNPDYIPVSVVAEIMAESSETVAMVEKEAKERLLKLLHPIEGGLDGNGWPFGRGLWKSDLLRSLSGIVGLDRVENIVINPENLDDLSLSSLICVANEEDVTVNVQVNSGGAQL